MSHTMHPQSPPLTIGGAVLKESDDLGILGVTFDSKMTFEKHFRSVSRVASQRLGILRRSWRVFHDRLIHQSFQQSSCMSSDLVKVREWFDLWGMKLNASKTKTNIGLPRTRPPLTSAINTLLAIRYSTIRFTCRNHLNTLWSALLVNSPSIRQQVVYRKTFSFRNMIAIPQYPGRSMLTTYSTRITDYSWSKIHATQRP